MLCPSTPLSNCARGFTLIEMLVVITISAILLAVGVPMFNASIASARASDAANSLKGAIELAASTANGPRGLAVSACRVANPAATPPVCDMAAVGNYASGDWAAGWVVFVEANAAGALGVIDAGDEILQVQQAFQAAGVQHPEILGAGGPVASITFNAAGDRVGGGGINSFNIVYPQAAAGTAVARRTLTLTIKGQVSVVRN